LAGGFRRGFRFADRYGVAVVNYFPDDPATALTSDRVVARLRLWQRLVLVPAFGVLALISGLMLFAALDTGVWAAAPFALAALVIMAVVTVRVPVIAIVADGSGVVVRNPFRTYRVTWPQVASFRGTPAPHVQLTSGKSIRIVAASRAAFESSARFATLINRLEQLRVAAAG
jgi:hypothetical protein